MLFPGGDASQVFAELEAMRASIASYRMAVRRPDRPRNIKAGAAMRQTAAPEKTLSVTVSIGVAEPDASGATPASVLKAADQALYRAKGEGRNRVVR